MEREKKRERTGSRGGDRMLEIVVSRILGGGGGSPLAFEIDRDRDRDIDREMEGKTNRQKCQKNQLAKQCKTAKNST